MKTPNTQYCYWLSFSYKGRTTGVCNVKASNQQEALQKSIDLGIHPAHDDIYICEIDSLELKENILFTKKEMEALQYKSVQYKSSKS